MIRIALAVLFALVGVAAAQSIQKWKTPDGKFYIGVSPPQGSVFLGAAGERGPQGNGESGVSRKLGGLKPPAAPDADAVRTDAGSEARRAETERRRQGTAVTFQDVREKNSGEGRFLEGTVANRARVAVRDVKVCMEGICRFTDPSALQPGAQGTFSLPIASGYGASGGVTVTWEGEPAE